MANGPEYRRNPPNAIENHDARVREAWRLHRGMMLLQAYDPAVRDDELFRVFCAEAFARFEQVLEADV